MYILLSLSTLFYTFMTHERCTPHCWWHSPIENLHPFRYQVQWKSKADCVGRPVFTFHCFGVFSTSCGGLHLFSQLKPLQWSSCGGSRLRGRKPTTWLDCSAFAWSLSSSSSPLSLSLSSSSLPSNFVLHKKALNDIPVWHITYCRPSKPSKLSARGRRSKSQQGSINFFVHPQILGRVR